MDTELVSRKEGLDGRRIMSGDAGHDDRALGPYQILAPLSAGGMGVVYQARHRESGQEVALKTVRLHRADLLHSIRREIHALRRIQHPGVVRVLDEGIDAGLPWYAMELLRGVTLRRRLGSWWPEQPTLQSLNATTWGPAGLRGTPESAPVVAQDEPSRSARRVCAGGSLVEVLTLVRRLCDALAFIHGEGIVHRDLKPENIFMLADGVPVLVDFGLVTLFGGARGRESLEVGGSFEGSVHYVSPEQIDGKLVDARADLYALGCILYELVTGQPPFPGEGWDVLNKHMNQAPIPPSRLVEEVPHALEDLILRLMAKEPRERIGYASDVAAALAELGAEGGPTVSARPYLYRPEFAGRSDVLGDMERQLDRARSSSGGCVLIGGDSGAGKTRLAVEIATSARRRSFRVVTGECLPVENTEGPRGARGGPLHPFKPLLQAIADHCRTHGPEVSERVLGPRVRLLAFYEPTLALVPARRAHAEPEKLPAQAAQERLVASLVETIVAFAQGEPLLLVLDDLHWADALSMAVLAALQKTAVERARLMVLGTYRTGDESDALRALSETPGVTRIKLGGLDRGTVATMVRDMLALPAPPDSFVRFLTAQSEGNPFFVAEYLRAAISEGMLRRNEAGRWQLAEAGQTRELLHEALPLPGALRDLVGRRLAGLSDGARYLAEVGAVLGREFEGELLAEVTGLADDEMLESLQELLRKHVTEEGKPGRLRFVHDKLREVAYEGISPERRGLYHRAAARALEERHASSDGFGLLYPLLAHHWAMAGVPEKTQGYLEKAGDRSLRTGANAEAAEFFRRALAIAPCGTDVDEARRRAGWARKLGEALYGIGNVADSKQHLLQAMAALGWPMPRTRVAWVWLLVREIGRQLLHLSCPVGGGEARASEREHLATVALTAARLSECYYFNQELLPTVALSVLAVNLAERAGQGGEIRRIYGHLGYLAGLGRLDVLARRYFGRAHGEGRDLGDPSAVAFGFILESMYHVTFGRYARAAARAQDALRVLPGAWNAKDAAIEKLEAGYVPPEVYLAKNLLAHVDFYEGRLGRSLQGLVEERGLARAQSNVQYEAWTEIDMARGMIAVDRLDEAVGLLKHAQNLLVGRGDKSSEMQSQGLLATAYLYQGELAQALQVADGVVELMREVQPAMFTEGCGFEGIALVYLAAWEREGAGAVKTAKRAWEACSVLSRFALLFPLARPAALRCMGRAHWLAGHRWRAQRCWRRSLAIARRLGMHYDVALVQLELARYAVDDPAERERMLRDVRDTLHLLGRTHQERELDVLLKAANG